MLSDRLGTRVVVLAGGSRLGLGLVRSSQVGAVGLLVQAALVFTYLFAHDLRAFAAIALLFGLAYGGVMPLYALVTREYFGGPRALTPRR